MMQTKSLMLLLAFATSAPAVAQATHMNMPEGSKDVTLSVITYYGPRHLGSADNKLRIAPLISAQWANGIFINMNVLGLHLSRTPGISYGPLISPSVSRSSEPTPGGTKAKIRFTPEVGGFFNYRVVHGMSLGSQLMYGGSSDRRGLRMDLNANFGTSVAEHHGIGLSAGVTLANRSALQADYAVTPWQASASGLSVHETKGGIQETSLTASWGWELSTKYMLRSSLQHSRLHGSAAASSRMERTDGVSIMTILTYQF